MSGVSSKTKRVLQRRFVFERRILRPPARFQLLNLLSTTHEDPPSTSNVSASRFVRAPVRCTRVRKTIRWNREGNNAAFRKNFIVPYSEPNALATPPSQPSTVPSPLHHLRSGPRGPPRPGIRRPKSPLPRTGSGLLRIRRSVAKPAEQRIYPLTYMLPRENESGIHEPLRSHVEQLERLKGRRK